MTSKVSLSPKSKVINFIILKKITRLCLNVADQQFICASVENNVIMFTVVPLQVVENKAVSAAVAGIKLVNCPKVTLFIPISWQSCNPWPRPQTSHRSELAGKRFWRKIVQRNILILERQNFSPNLSILKNCRNILTLGTILSEAIFCGQERMNLGLQTLPLRYFSILVVTLLFQPYFLVSFLVLHNTFSQKQIQLCPFPRDWVLERQTVKLGIYTYGGFATQVNIFPMELKVEKKK